MANTVEVTRTVDNSQQIWRFWFNDRNCRLQLNSYLQCSRATTRHKWRVDAAWRWTDKRAATIATADVPLPMDVTDEAMRQFVAGITVGMPEVRG